MVRLFVWCCYPWYHRKPRRKLVGVQSSILRSQHGSIALRSMELRGGGRRSLEPTFLDCTFHRLYLHSMTSSWSVRSPKVDWVSIGSSCSYSFVPLYKFCWKTILLCVCKQIVHELWENGFKLLESCCFGHGCRWVTGGSVIWEREIERRLERIGLKQECCKGDVNRGTERCKIGGVAEPGRRDRDVLGRDFLMVPMSTFDTQFDSDTIAFLWKLIGHILQNGRDSCLQNEHIQLSSDPPRSCSNGA